ncbi:ABC transporter ATP-binding protein [soil metagenome]
MARRNEPTRLYSLAPGAPELVVAGVTKRFDAKVVLAEINFTIAAGEMVAIVGASGGGKTVLLDHLTGLMAPSAGSVHAADHTQNPPKLEDLAKLKDEALDNVRLAWAIVFQRNALFSGTVFENIALWLREHSGLSEEEIATRVEGSVKAAALDVKDVIQKDRDSLSGGMAKRVAIARAIAVDPLVLFYDEPTTGLDPVISGQIHELIWNVHHRPRADTGERSAVAPRAGGAPQPAAAARTSIVVTHDKDLLRRVGPRVIMLDQGTIIFDGPYGRFTHCDHPAAVQYLREMPDLHTRR